MTQEHPITPPPELVQQWINEDDDLTEWRVAIQAARWGAAQELEACCEWLHWQNLATHQDLIPSLRAARRPKPPSLKEQAFQCLKNIDDACESEEFSRSEDTDIIRRALEALRD